MNGLHLSPPLPLLDVTGCRVSPFDLSDADKDGGARSRRQARDHVMDELYISCPLRPRPTFMPKAVRSSSQRVKSPDPTL
jgi:hypothetical protein